MHLYHNCVALTWNDFTTRRIARVHLLLKKSPDQLLIQVGVVGWGDGAKYFSVPGRPINFDNSRTMAYCTCNRCGLGLLEHCFFRLSLIRPDIC